MVDERFRAAGGDGDVEDVGGAPVKFAVDDGIGMRRENGCLQRVSQFRDPLKVIVEYFAYPRSRRAEPDQPRHIKRSTSKSTLLSTSLDQCFEWSANSAALQHEGRGPLGSIHLVRAQAHRINWHSG